MQLKTITIQNFRNYSSESLKPGPVINVIYGENGQGKTNLLEAVYYLFSSISHRTRREKDLIKWDENFLKVQGEVCFDNYGSKELQVLYSLKRKDLKINGNLFSVDRYFSQFPVVILFPQDLYLITEGPAIRRRFMNTEIIRLYPSYYHHLLNYYRVLRQRNILLKKPVKNKNDLFSWDILLASHGSKVIIKRLQYIKKIKGITGKYQKVFTSDTENIEILYKSVMDIKDIINGNVYEGIEHKVNEIFLETLERKRDEDYKRGYTTTGPHVEDISVLMNNRETRKYSSQGQQRTTVISIKLAQAELLLEEKKEKPLILMDDCFSELDEARRNLILNFIKDKGYQCMITGYGKIKLPGNYPVSFFKIHKGIITDG